MTLADWFMNGLCFVFSGVSLLATIFMIVGYKKAEHIYKKEIETTRLISDMYRHLPTRKPDDWTEEQWSLYEAWVEEYLL